MRLGTTYLVSTPIGNLGDFSSRAVETLKTCAHIFAEDTRRTRILAQHYQIRTPIRRYQETERTFREMQSAVESGESIALLSDAGTPLIQDPGLRWVQHCHANALPITAIPGACAALVALTLSGFPTHPFQFIGFLPRTHSKLLKTLQTAVVPYRGTTIMYESPHRLHATLRAFLEVFGEEPLFLARELTKQFEECVLGSPSQLLELTPRGEYVIVKSPVPTR